MQVLDLVRVLHGDVVGKISDSTPPPCSLRFSKPGVDFPTFDKRSPKVSDFSENGDQDLVVAVTHIHLPSGREVRREGREEGVHREMPRPTLAPRECGRQISETEEPSEKLKVWLGPPRRATQRPKMTDTQTQCATAKKETQPDEHCQMTLFFVATMSQRECVGASVTNACRLVCTVQQIKKAQTHTLEEKKEKE